MTRGVLQRLASAVGPVTLTSDEARWLAEEFERLSRQGTVGEAGTSAPAADRGVLRQQVEQEDEEPLP